MYFLSTCYRQQGENAVSLLLQQYEYKQAQVLFALVCTGEGEQAGRAGAYMTEQLLEWFRELKWKKRIRKPREEMLCLETQLTEAIEQADFELKSSGLVEPKKPVSLAGVLCMGENYLLLHRGDVGICLMNTAFGRGYVRRLAGEGERQRGSAGQTAGADLAVGAKQELYTETGVLQSDIGLLFATNSFYESVSETMLKEGLFVGEVVTEAQMHRHLLELAREGERLGGIGMGAVLLRSCKAKGAEMGRPGIRGEGEIGRLVQCPHNFAFEESEGREKNNQYICRRLLGKGSFSEVYLVEEEVTGKQYACKISKNIKLLQREFAIMKELEHPLFPEVFGFWREAKKGFLLMEYVPGSSLAELLGRRGHFSARQTVRIGMELAEGLLHLHERRQPILFRDVKPDNIIVRQDGRIKLLDFGCVCVPGEIPDSRAGTPHFAAPEQLGGKKILTEACDVYGVGQTMKVMLGIFGGEGNSRKLSAEQRQLLRILSACTGQEASNRLPDMRSLMKALMPLCEEKERGVRVLRWRKRAFKWNIVCRKNIWESNYKNA